MTKKIYLEPLKGCAGALHFTLLLVPAAMEKIKVCLFKKKKKTPCIPSDYNL